MWLFTIIVLNVHGQVKKRNDRNHFVIEQVTPYTDEDEETLKMMLTHTDAQPAQNKSQLITAESDESEEDSLLRPYTIKKKKKKKSLLSQNVTVTERGKIHPPEETEVVHKTKAVHKTEAIHKVHPHIHPPLPPSVELQLRNPPEDVHKVHPHIHPPLPPSVELQLRTHVPFYKKHYKKIHDRSSHIFKSQLKASFHQHPRLQHTFKSRLKASFHQHPRSQHILEMYHPHKYHYKRYKNIHIPPHESKIVSIRSPSNAYLLQSIDDNNEITNDDLDFDNDFDFNDDDLSFNDNFNDDDLIIPTDDDHHLSFNDDDLGFDTSLHTFRVPLSLQHTFGSRPEEQHSFGNGEDQNDPDVFDHTSVHVQKNEHPRTIEGKMEHPRTMIPDVSDNNFINDHPKTIKTEQAHSKNRLSNNIDDKTEQAHSKNQLSNNKDSQMSLEESENNDVHSVMFIKGRENIPMSPGVNATSLNPKTGNVTLNFYDKVPSIFNVYNEHPVNGTISTPIVENNATTQLLKSRLDPLHAELESMASQLDAMEQKMNATLQVLQPTHRPFGPNHHHHHHHHDYGTMGREGPGRFSGSFQTTTPRIDSVEDPLRDWSPTPDETKENSSTEIKAEDSDIESEKTDDDEANIHVDRYSEEARKSRNMKARENRLTKKKIEQDEEVVRVESKNEAKHNTDDEIKDVRDEWFHGTIHEMNETVFTTPPYYPVDSTPGTLYTFNQMMESFKWLIICLVGIFGLIFIIFPIIMALPYKSKIMQVKSFQESDQSLVHELFDEDGDFLISAFDCCQDFDTTCYSIFLCPLRNFDSHVITKLTPLSNWWIVIFLSCFPFISLPYYLLKRRALRNILGGDSSKNLCSDICLLLFCPICATIQEARISDMAARVKTVCFLSVKFNRAYEVGDNIGIGVNRGASEDYEILMGTYDMMNNIT